MTSLPRDREMSTRSDIGTTLYISDEMMHILRRRFTLFHTQNLIIGHNMSCSFRTKTQECIVVQSHV